MKTSIALLFISSPLSAWAQSDINAVEEGKKAFETYGCAVCHAVEKKDATVRTGPNLYGLFLNQPRDREVAHPETGERRTVKADRNYYNASVRTSWDALAVAESGPTTGEPFPRIMPMYSGEVVPDEAVENIWHYLRTRADEGSAGPAEIKVRQAEPASAKNPLDIPNEIVVTKRTRVFRAPLRGSSGRALHVGQANGMNYTFDPRVLSLRNIWAGGFINLTQERRGRGRPGSVRGKGHRVFIQGGGILQPLSASGEPVDFEFKEPDVMDHARIERWLWEDRDFPELLASVDADFRGYVLDPASGDPTFLFRVGKNRIRQTIRLTDDGRLSVTVTGIREPQSFKVSTEGLSDIKAQNSRFENEIWTLKPSKAGYTLSARLSGGLVARSATGREEDWSPQEVVT
ncbi:MAG: cytochrome c, partial [Verrucomicrobiota bacterium]